MRRTGIRAHAPAALLAAALLTGCGGEQEAAAPAPEGTAPTAAAGSEEFYAQAQQSAEAQDEPLRNELLKTCDKWRHLDRPCDEAQVRRDQLECWVEKGQAALRFAEARQMRPRARYMRSLLEVNLCMELRRWRKIRPGRDF
jgi:hypothetical protein